ncbi:PREDICTED: espin-like [Amphimedon queenslandica]|uniref:Uncharacterized protein n=2 Tax=Amphimedon queenslandica TaxID=400682 RepID=A0AAN0JS55_AMPQE|nr:PREDICTED: espin-like [Amphimedon queenslandica]|eukprot:XP_019859709.1 PREDICTED: espin-like [Amphimedon queenslandica]
MESLEDSVDSLEHERGDQCWDAFTYKDHDEAVRLLLLVEEPNLVKRTYYCDNTSLLHLSSRNGWLEITKDLITKYHCDPQEKDSVGWTCLHYAAVGNHVDVMQYIINECYCDPMVTDVFGDTILHIAAGSRSLDVMKYLINHQVSNLIATNRCGESILHYAAEHIDIVKYLINNCNCDPVAISSNKRTILHSAAGKNSPDVINYLINELHFDPMAIDKSGWTPLHVAADYGHSLAVECLLSTGKCDPLAKDNQGRTPLQLAKQWIGTNKSTLPIFKKFGDIKSFHPIDSYVNVLLVGYPGAGKKERKENISTLSDIMSATKDNNDYNLSDKKEDVLDALCSLQLTGLISVLKSEDKKIAG